MLAMLTVSVRVQSVHYRPRESAISRSTGEQIQTHRDLLLAVISTKRKLDKTPDLGILVHKETDLPTLSVGL